MKTITACCIVPLSLGALLLSVGNCSGMMNPHHLPDTAVALSMRDCLRCHDTGKAAGICPGDFCLDSRGTYPPVGKESSYAPVSELEKADSMLEEERVSCLSCHDLTKRRPHVIRDGHKLCLICHTSLNAKR
ncbi:MAG: hypothetical protein A2075_22945 [Geobacteraceae bacterium GWC2_58_44]|nr:MAG: hypothetical protein A2075_22945 [Geobacteraceae bacterium GWC2_58_44]HBG07814.1 hypothetical protein [Geobacter sp.]